MNAANLLRPSAFAGVIEYARNPVAARAWGGAFNNQHKRVRLISEIVAAAKPAFIVETGTNRGATTEYLARAFSVPVHSVENNPHSYGYSWARLRKFGNVAVHFGDSPRVLERMLSRIHPSTASGLFYLDAHWGAVLPLLDELMIIYRRGSADVAVIDDCEVPDDDGYLFDDYGPGKKICLDYFSEVVQRHQLGVFFPRAPAALESGERRGCAVLGGGAALEALRTVQALRELR